jgi:hypothetical protein
MRDVVNGVGDFLQQVLEIRGWKGWFDRDSRWGPWFRGQERSDWKLEPVLYRGAMTFDKVKKDEIEDELREEFIKRAPVLCDHIPSGSEKSAEWEWYFMMRHFGAATRLLDWSEGALIGLYFAVRNNAGDHDAAVWVLDPYRLNKRALGKQWVIPPSATGLDKKDEYVRKVERWLPTRFSQMRGLPRLPVAIEPTHVVRRISSQHSCFTIHGQDESAFEKLSRGRKGYLVKIVVNRHKVKEIRKDLRLCGINDATIYPDLGGLSQALNARWELK